MGLVNRLVPTGQALETAVSLAHELARFPQRCLRSDRLSAYEQWSLPTRRPEERASRHRGHRIR